MILGLLASPALSCAQNPKMILRVDSLVMLGLVYWLLLDLVQAAYELNGISCDGIDGALVGIGLFAGAFWIAWLFPPHGLPRFLREAACWSLNPGMTFWLAVAFFLLAMLNYALACHFDVVLMFSALFCGRWDAPWMRGALGGWEAFRDHLQYFGYVLPTLTVLQATQRGWAHRKTILCCLMSLTVLLFLSQSGGRRILGVTVGAAIACWILTSYRLSLRRCVAALCAMGGLLILMQLMLEYRDVGFSRALKDNTLRISSDHLNVDDNFLRLAQTIDLVPDQHPYVYGKRLLFTLVRPIPRVFWEGKPTTPGFDLAMFRGQRGVSLSSSVIADWYVMGGWSIVLLGGFFYGRLAGMWSGLLALKHNLVAALIYSVGAMAIFASLRSLDELVLQSYPLLALLMVLRVFFSHPNAGKSND
jgi:hypothetical protein